MLKKITEGRIESDNGFSIQICRGILEYNNGSKFIELNLDYDPKTRKNYIYISDDKELTSQEKDKITKEIKEAVKLLKGDFEVI